MSSTDRIEREIVLRAPPPRVWRALTDAKQFGTWFRVALENDFVTGERTLGRVTYPGYEHIRFEVLVERIEAETYFAFRWHPYPADPEADYSAEPMTLVEFRLEAAGAGTRLAVTESGFDRIPAHRREEAFRMNAEGWTGQIENIRHHVDDPPA